MRHQRWLFVLTLALAFVSQSWASQVSEPRILKAFEERIQAYLKVEKDLESALPALRSNADAKQISDHQLALAVKVIAAQRASRQGDIFGPEISAQLQTIIRNALRQPGATAVRRTIDEGDPVKVTVLHVNERYPEDIPLTTMPPTLLGLLPAIPREFAYRIIGRALALQDVRTNIIVDFLPNALP